MTEAVEIPFITTKPVLEQGKTFSQKAHKS